MSAAEAAGSGSRVDTSLVPGKTPLRVFLLDNSSKMVLVDAETTAEVRGARPRPATARVPHSAYSRSTCA